MPDQNDQYADFSAFYDIYVGERLEDLAIYLEYTARSQTPVLEVGAGTGRLTIPIAKAGASVFAVDISPSMLAILESRLSTEPPEIRRRVRVICADARQLDLEVSFDLIMVPFYTFNYLLTPGDQGAALRSFSRHLSDGGHVLIDVFVPYRLIDHCPSDPILKVDAIDPNSGNAVRGWNTYTIDQERQYEYRRHAFEITEPDGGVVRREFTTQRRYSYPRQLEQVFSDSGLYVQSVFSGPKKDSPASMSEQLLYVLRKQNE